jgi:endonuclease/exonuclease/phosphatase family metal-dependent hydrolase
VHKASLLVASFHATHLIASNALRRQQLSLALDTLNNMYDKRPTVLVGDFNYPLFHGGLKRATKRLGYDLHIPDNPTYSGRHVMGRFDMAVTVRVSAHMQVLPFGLSDHAPILLRVEE